jgi:hypothetical protein
VLRVLWAFFGPLVTPSGRWNHLPGAGLPRPGLGLPQGRYTSRYPPVNLETGAADVVRRIRSDLDRFYRDSGLDCLGFLVWLSPDGTNDVVVVHARGHRLGTVADAALSDTVRQYYDPRHPRHCHTEAQLMPDNAIEVRVIDRVSLNT